MITQNLEQSPITEYIYLYKHKSLSDSLIQSILQFVDSRKLVTGTVGTGIQDRSIRDALVSDISPEFEYYTNLTTIITETLYEYVNCKTLGKFVGLPPTLDIEILQYLKYEPGGHYVEHVDKFYGCAGDYKDRVFTAICYLNDDYAGGHLRFPYVDINLKPEKGSILIFPSTWEYCHLVEPVYRGVRHSLVSWFLDVNLK